MTAIAVLERKEQPVIERSTGPTTAMVIEDVRVERRGDGSLRLSGRVDGDEIWYLVAGVDDLSPRAEPLLGAALLPAIASSRPIVVRDGELSPQLFQTLPHIQRLLELWTPGVKRVPVEAANLVAPSARPIVTSTYSGGVDSLSTFMRHRDEITHLLFINGFDMREDGAWDAAEARMRESADKLGKAVISVNTNAHEFCARRGVTMPAFHGTLLCTIIAALAPQRAYVASTFTYRELKPWGSHPLLDPLWATEATAIHHDACELRRTEKTELIASDPEMLALLQVCWGNRTHNCGRCSKCVRTRIALEIIGAGPGPFPDHDPMQHIQKLVPDTTANASYTWDLWKLACDHGERAIAAQLRRILDRFRRKRAVKNLVKTAIGDRVTMALHRLSGKPWLTSALPLHDPDDLR